MKFTKPIVKIGNSHLVRVPKKKMDKESIQEGEIVDVTIRRKKV